MISLQTSLTPRRRFPFVRSRLSSRSKSTCYFRGVLRHFRPLVIVEYAGFVEFVFFITQELGRVEIALPNRQKIHFAYNPLHHRPL
ncbi:hypothetical protein PHYSODRAFT_472448 [Phytophthora sojae]|uniref:Uncharacterized protein n=1 Tax=Phytophthora sojae (strain P6497) TaxID=1094619 RepID=G4YF02_PHYSP|nr:hypothetical protein PHYSODRAFT_472448 [Phytophthora sojae]EGZ27585.1 hypothetical protein PHYSODRAFT_472448 [Phytophthora sojae]|eukprot:XP_009514860.1 hypothetical protein PHYSODRAFT_472448 [Phytophthora sojae]